MIVSSFLQTAFSLSLVILQLAGSMLLKKKKAKPGYQGQEMEGHICAITAMAPKTPATSLAPQSWREQVQHRTREHLQLGNISDESKPFIPSLSLGSMDISVGNWNRHSLNYRHLYIFRLNFISFYRSLFILFTEFYLYFIYF